ncbi:MAG: hypothetical protein BAJALOKI3v1_820006 [Promethearchaeota archaeon]|nr:MAG: hypothetical protein BAJALOKI3v1_820006 [Candidatus Lokiarchaeota archaeon]
MNFYYLMKKASDKSKKGLEKEIELHFINKNLDCLWFDIFYFFKHIISTYFILE